MAKLATKTEAKLCLTKGLSESIVLAYANYCSSPMTRMKICLPTNTNLGLQSELAANFGAAPWFLVIESDTLKTLAIDRTDAIQRDRPITMDLIMCQSMTQQLYTTLRTEGVPIFGTYAKTVAEALTHYQEGDLRDLADNVCCGGSRVDCNSDHLDSDIAHQGT